MTPEKLIDLLLSKAAELRKAGVLSLELAGLTVHLAPDYPAPAADDGKGFVPEEAEDPLSDPWTFGGRVPGFKRLRGRDDG